MGGATPSLLAAENDGAAPAPAGIGTARQPNHLIGEKSAYLRQHAYNPVDWHPWGEEAFAKARRENRPIFLSIGYSTCHWCHVMARESFEDETIARLLNASFVCIKVDREERPDVDQIYLAFVEATTGSAGWPMTVFLTPDLKPFYGGSYFPPDDRQGRPGLRSLVTQFAKAWNSDPGRIIDNSDRILRELRAQLLKDSPPDKAGDAAIDEGFREIADGFDSKYGGFGGAPKFPRPAVLAFLLQLYAADPFSDRGLRARDMALFTLRRMAEGGIHDVIGGGFHRYSVDESWHVPHFEKMLYDQAQLAESYLAAYQITHEAIFAATARDILDFVRRDLTSPDGGFFSAVDADSLLARGKAEHGEGAFYVWTKAEIDEVVGPDRARLFNYYYGVEPDGNARPHPEFSGRNILMQRHSIAETAQMAGKSATDVDRDLGESRGLLYAARNGRPRPGIDDNVIASWNGLMISAFAKGYQVLGDPSYLDSASTAAAFVEKRMFQGESGLLLRCYNDGTNDIPGFADDYACVIQGLLDLYESSFDVHWLAWAQRLQSQQDALFWDSGPGGYFATTGRDTTVLIRTKPAFDGAEPSANSVASLNLMRLSSLFDDSPSRARAEKTINAFARKMRQSASSLSGMLVGIDWLRSPPRQIVIDGRVDGADTRALLAELNRHFIPRKTVVLADGSAGQQFFARQAEFFRSLPETAPAAAMGYVCENYTCQLPTGDVAKFGQLLAPVARPRD
jgi:hypothetical protein